MGARLGRRRGKERAKCRATNQPRQVRPAPKVCSVGRRPWLRGATWAHVLRGGFESFNVAFERRAVVLLWAVYCRATARLSTRYNYHLILPQHRREGGIRLTSRDRRQLQTALRLLPRRKPRLHEAKKARLARHGFRRRRPRPFGNRTAELSYGRSCELCYNTTTRSPNGVAPTPTPWAGDPRGETSAARTPRFPKATAKTSETRAAELS